MLWIFLSMICAVSIALLFKFFERAEITLIPVLFWNYLVCFFIAFFQWIAKSEPAYDQIGQWGGFSVILGVLFVVGFFVMGKTIQHYGVVVGSVSQKMSLIVSASFGILIFSEPLTSVKIAGIILALIAVLLINIPGNDSRKFRYLLIAALAFLPILNLLIAGSVESLLHFVEVGVLGDEAESLRLPFLMGIFLCASVVSGAWSLIKFGGFKTLLERRFILSGILLGVPNFFSAFFILLALSSGIDGSLVFPMLNVGVILLSALFAVILFRESIGVYRMVGLVIAVVAISIMAGYS